MARPANSELVAVAWLKTCPGIATSQVSTQLPVDNTTWSASGFVKVGPVVGGATDIYNQTANPIIQIETYAVNPNTKNPAWDKAADLMEYIRAGCYNYSLLGRALTLRTGYNTAIVQTASIMSEPTRNTGDAGGYAVMRVDLQLRWVEVPG